MIEFVVHAQFDAAADVCWVSNDQLPITTEAPSFEELVNRVMAIAPEIADMNGHGQITIHFTTAERTGPDEPRFLPVPRTHPAALEIAARRLPTRRPIRKFKEGIRQ